MINMGHLERTTAVPGSRFGYFPEPGLLGICGPCPLSGFGLLWRRPLLEPLVECARGQRGQTTLPTCLLVGSIDGSGWHVTWRFKLFRNEGLHQFAWGVWSFRYTVPLRRLARK